MDVQKGLVVEKPGSAFQMVETIKRSSPGPKQALVKSLFVALNPVEILMSKHGVLTTEMPAILGSDFCGLVVEVGPECAKLQTGDYVYGLCRLGQNQYSPFQETFLVDEDLVFKGSERPEPVLSAGIGVGVLTAAFGIVTGGNLPLPHHGTKIAEHDEWIVVLGGHGTVGQYAIQIARLCGFKVAASCSTTKTPTVLTRGANATFNNRVPVADQAAEIEAITSGNFGLVFDATGACHEVALKALEVSAEKGKRFSTVDNATEIATPSDVELYRVIVGAIGRTEEPGNKITAQAAQLVPLLQRHIEDGTITPVHTELFKGTGWEILIQALAYFEAGLHKNKLVVRVQEG